MTSVQLGRLAAFYLNTGTYGSPVWSLVANISDLTVSGEWDLADASTRESAVKMQVPTLVDLSVAGKMKFANGDTNTVSIVQAFFNQTILDIMALNGPQTTAGNFGVRFPCRVTSRNEDQGVGVAIFEDVKFVPYPTANPPCWVQVVGSAPVFNTI